MDSRQFPFTPPFASFVGPIDTSTFKLKYPSFWPEGQERASGFIRLGTYLIPAPTGIVKDKGVYPFHIFVLFPLTIQPWQSMCGWMKNPKGQGPFTTRNWLSGSGSVLGILNRELVEDSEQRDADCPILVVIPDTWEWIPSTFGDGLSGENINSASKLRNPTTPSQGSKSRNPFSSPAKVDSLTSPSSSKRNEKSSSESTLTECETGPHTDDTNSRKYISSEYDVLLKLDDRKRRIFNTINNGRTRF